MTNTSPTGAQDLVWGNGNRRFEIFLEPTCPFSGKAFHKFKPFLDLVGEEKLSVAIRLNSQPWHTFSSVVSRAILAAAHTDGGKEAAFQVMRAVFDNREEFVLTEHRMGDTMTLSPQTILARIEALTGLSLATAFSEKAVTQDMKWHARYARQNGIHATPTFTIDGLVNEKISSGDAIQSWANALTP